MEEDESLFEELAVLVEDYAQEISEAYDLGHTLSDSPSHVQLVSFQSRLSKLDPVYKAFVVKANKARALASKLKKLEELDKIKALITKVRAEYYDSVTLGAIFSQSTEASNPINNSNSFNEVDGSRRIKLPALECPTFNGDISEWAGFKDTFQAIYHDNPHLTPVEKFHYLKACLKDGAAKQAIASIALQGANYTQAWDTLCRKFDNKRIQASHYLMKVLDFPSISKPNLISLNKFNEEFMENATSLRNLALDDPDGFILYTIGLRCLDPKTKEKFESEHSAEDAFPSFQNFQDFIQKQCRQLQTEALTSKPDSNSSAKSSAPPYKKHQVPPKNQVFMASRENSNAEATNSCPICKESHKIYFCSKFRGLNSADRYEKIKALRLCFNCFSSSHQIQACTSSNLCKHCSKKHHSMLHTWTSSTPSLTKSTDSSKTASKPPQTSTEKTPPATNSNATVLAASLETSTSVLLATACARISDSAGKFHSVRMLIDSGSQRSFITTSCSRRIGLERTKNWQLLKGFSDTTIQGGNYQAKCTIVPRHKDNPQFETQAIIINRITSKVPACPIPNQLYAQFAHLDLADPEFTQSNEIDVLLGADLFPKILLQSEIIRREGYPTAINTSFGWILMGSFDNQSSFGPALTFLSSVESLDTLVKRFWETENPVCQKNLLSPEELRCENHFKETHSRDEDGRYMVQLPFKTDKAPDLSSSKYLAEKRFKNFEYKLYRNPTLKSEYDKIIKEYQDLNFISPATSTGKYFLPHHCVVRDAVSTKVRIVFDGSASTKNGSLNDHLLKGPKLQNDIRCVLLDFRKFPFAFTADITQMYLQVLVHPKDRAFQQFFYRANNSDAIQTFELNRVTFGLSSSPFLAIRVLHQLVEDEGAAYPKGSEVLLKSTYVDDILACAPTENEAIEIQKQLIQLLKKGGFELKKWATNSTSLLPQASEHTINSIKQVPIESSAVSILGLQWDTSTDTLFYKIQALKLTPTKRGVLSAIARMYDPLGYLTPIIFRAKMIMQNLWKENLDWDDPLPEHLSIECSEFFGTLSLLSDVRLPRCILSSELKSVDLIGFADASTKGFAAVVYLRTEFTNGSRRIHLLISKSRLAPLKTLTVPRLELCAAQLLVQTIESIKTFLDKIPIMTVHLFTDSTITLAWLKIPPNQLKTFVSHRVASIIDVYPSPHWHHVSSEDNAADLASRGTIPSEFLEKETWWTGPKWLQSDECDWPISTLQNSNDVDSDLPEVKRPSDPVAVLHQKDNQEDYVIDISRFSNWSKLVRVFCYVKRFINKTRKKILTTSGPIRLDEIHNATHYLIERHQKHHFDLSNLSKNASLKSLAPFIDSSGILRVGGRLENSPLSYERKHPILLSSKSYFTSLLVDYFHISFLHAGPKLLQSLVARKYWILSARNLCRQRVHKCLVCHKFRSQYYSQMMADLPESRFEQGRAFINVGVDLAGPIMIKESHRRKAPTSKAYLVIFICLSTKAIHTEIVSNLTTENFIAALERFVARRGAPTKIFSDNGTNFIGADRYLREAYKWMKDNEAAIVQRLNDHEISWEFNPPAAPHFGGLWEAGVKSIKGHLRRVIGVQLLTYEELSTMAARIESVLNSRPLYEISTESYDVLTPAHFLIGAPLVSLPEESVVDVPDNRLKRWYLVRKNVSVIWNRWRLEYLHTLQQRVKWTKTQENLKKNTLVLLKEEGQPVMSWPVARVVEVFPGKDGKVRVVKVRTPSGEYVRPVTRLAPLLPKL